MKLVTINHQYAHSDQSWRHYRCPSIAKPPKPQSAPNQQDGMTWKPENQTLYSDCFVGKFPRKVKLLPREACTLPYLPFAHSQLTHPSNLHSGAGHAALERTWAEGTPIISALGTGMQEDQKAKVLWYRQSLRPPTSLVTVSQRHPWADLQSLYVWFPLPRLASLSLLPWPHFWLFLTAPVSNPKFLQVFALTPSRVSHWPKLVTGEFKETWKNKPWSLLGESSVHSIEQGYMCVCADKRLVLCREYSLVSYCAISFVGFCCF